MSATPSIPRSVALLLAALALAGTVGSRLLAEKPNSAQAATQDSPEAHLGKGYEALKQDQYELAISEFQAALKLDPTLVLRARFPLAVALFESHKSAEARSELESVRHEVGEHPNVLYYLGRLDLEDRKFTDAVRNLTKAAVKPPFPDTDYYLGYAYFQQGDLTAAEKWLKQAAQANPRDARVEYQLGVVYRKQGREEEAAKAMALSKRLRQRDNDDSRLKLECGQKLDQGPRDEARTVCDQLYDPNNADKLTELGTIYGQHGDAEDALKPLRRAAELAPQSPQTQYNLAMAYYQLKRFAEARTPLTEALKRWPDLFPLNALNGAVLLQLGEDLPAYQALGHAHELNPQDSATATLLYNATFGLASKSEHAEQYSDSLRYFAEAAKLRPNEPEPHRRMADIYRLTGRPEQAATEQQEAERLAKNPGAE
jgi:tetratricopeptide (TPR) repeat protein